MVEHHRWENRRMKILKTSVSIFLLLALLVLSACGSNTATTPAPATPNQPPPPPPPPPGPTSPLPPIPNSPFNTNEFRFSFGLQAVNPIPAYDLGGTGRNVVVAVIDSGFDPTHGDLQGKFAPASADLITGGGRGTSIDGPDNHGAQVAAVIIAAKNGRGMHGVAFDATVLAIRIDSRNSCDNGDCSFFDSNIAAAILYAVANGADIINISLGGEGVSQAVLDAFAVARDAGVLIVTSAGNEGAPDPNTFSQTPGLLQFLGSGLIVGAVDANLDLASFSNAGGVSRQAFLVAPGVSVGTVQVNNIFTRVSGTSFAAPYVAGAAAILLSMFPNLDAQDLFDILTQSATDLGPNGLDPRFGNGLINIGAAIQPLGQTSFVTASAESMETTDVPTDETGSGFSIAFGDSLFRIDGLSQVMMLDSFRRSYFVDARASMINLYSSSFSLENAIDSHRSTQSLFLPISSTEGFSISFADPNRRIRPFIESLPMATQMQLEEETPYLFFDADVSKKMAVGVSFGFNPGIALERMAGRGSLNRDFLAARFDGTPHLSLSQDTKSLSLYRQLSSKTSAIVGTSFGDYDFSAQLPFSENLPRAQAISSYLRVNRYEGRFTFSMTAGFLKEDNAVLGSISTGALSLGSGAITNFVGFKTDVRLGKGFAITGQYTSGWTTIENAQNTFVSDTSTFRTSSFSAALTKKSLFRKNDRIGIAIYQPLRVESGQISLALPTGRDYAVDQILFTDETGSLAPSSRQLDVEVSYRIYGQKGYIFEANVIHQFNPGHTVNFAHANAFLLRVSKAY